MQNNLVKSLIIVELIALNIRIKFNFKMKYYSIWVRPHDNEPGVEVRTSKFGPGMQLSTITYWFWAWLTLTFNYFLFSNQFCYQTELKSH